MADSAKLNNFYEIQKAFYAYQEDYFRNLGDTTGSNIKPHAPGYKHFKRWEWYMEPRVYPSGDISITGNRWKNFREYENNRPADSRSMPGGNSNLSGNWVSLGPDSIDLVQPVHGIGRLNFVTFSPNGADTMWVGAASGGLWKSTDGGASWSTNTDSLTVLGCSDLAIDPVNTNVMYLATGDCNAGNTYSSGVLKSTDGGQTWGASGLSWTITSFVRIYKLLIDPTNTNIVYAAATTGIYRSADAGASWTNMVSGSFTDIAFKPGNPTVVYGVTQLDGFLGPPRFYKSTDSGLNFTNITNGLPAPEDLRRCAIGVSVDNPDYVYLLTTNNYSQFHGMYRSTDSGESFTERSTSPNIVGDYGWYYLSIEVNPADADDVFVGGLTHFRSMDGGVNWSQLNVGHVDIHDLTFESNTSSVLYSANDGGLHKSIDYGDSWTDLSKGLAITQIYRLGTSYTDLDRNICGTQDNGTYLNQQDNWDPISGGDGMECAIDYTDPNTIYSSLQYGVFLKSTDGGNTFNTIAYSSINLSGVDTNGYWLTPFVMHPTDNNTLFIGKDEIYKSADGGTNWSQLGTVPEANESWDIFFQSVAIAPSNPDRIYAARSTQFLTSSDGGATWVDYSVGLPTNYAYISYIVVSNEDPLEVYVSLSAYYAGLKVYKSVDGGANWTNYSQGLPNLPANCILYQNNTNSGVYVGTDVGVYFRSNSLAQWQPFYDSLPNVIVNELEIQYRADKIRAATYGRGMWESDLAIPDADFSATTITICPGDTVDFTDISGAPNLYWSFPGGAPDTSNSTTQSVIYANSGTYDVTLTVENANGTSTLTKTAYINVVNSLSPGSVSASVDTICSGDTINLSLLGSTGSPQWQSSIDGITYSDISGENTLTYTSTLNTTKYFRALLSSDFCDTVYSQPVQVTTLPLPVANITAGGPTTYCHGSIDLSADPAVGYLWSNGDTTQTITITSSGTYSLQVTGANGCTSAQDTINISSNMGAWTRKADLDDRGRQYPFCFTIGNKAYVGTGQTPFGYVNNFWEYDPSTDTWTQKPAFGGTGRKYSAYFSIGNKGYVGTGLDSDGKRKDFWEYDAITETWTQKADFASSERFAAVGFSVGSKGYLATGNDQTNLNDLWEYEPTNDTWTQKADIGGSGKVDVVAFVIDTAAYLVTGSGMGQQFWQYTPSTDTWVQKADFPGNTRTGASGFSIGSKGYVGTGWSNANNIYDDFWEYDSDNDVWTQKADFGGPPRRGGFGFAIGGKGYIGNGYDGSFYGDLWEYTPGNDLLINNFTFTQNDPIVDFQGNGGGGLLPYSYFWDFGDGNTSSILSPSHTYIQGGNYEVVFCLTDASDCMSCDTQQVNIIITEVHTNEAGTTQVYPNPATTEIQVSGIVYAHARLYNNLGQMVANYTSNDKLHVGHLAKGVYTLELVDEHNTPILRNKIVISN